MMGNATFDQFSLGQRVAWKIRAWAGGPKTLDKLIERGDLFSAYALIQSGCPPAAWAARQTSLDLMSNASSSMFHCLLRHGFSPPGIFEKRLIAISGWTGRPGFEKNALDDIAAMSTKAPPWIGCGESALIASIGLGRAPMDLLLSMGASPDGPDFCERLRIKAPLCSEKTIHSSTLIAGSMVSRRAVADLDILRLRAHFEHLEITDGIKAVSASSCHSTRRRL